MAGTDVAHTDGAHTDVAHTDGARIVIDSESCTGHGLCYGVAKRLLHFDDRGYGVVIRAELDASVMDEARRAVAACPEMAIQIVETHGRPLPD
jgi:ferredoxin